MKIQPLHRAACAVITAILSLLVFSGLPGLPARAAAPNIIVIVADDLAWHDLTVQGATDLVTPNLDWMANNGVRFTNGYVTAPVCSPSRAGLMTGRYQQRFGHETNPGTSLEHNPRFGLPSLEVTIGERFKALNLNYATGWIGKSHLGWNAPAHPNVMGFDHFLGFLESHHHYVNANAMPQRYDDDSIRPLTDLDLIQRNGAILPINPYPFDPARELPYLTELFSAEIDRFIDTHANANRPFLLYAPFNAVHFTLETTAALDQRFNDYLASQGRTITYTSNQRATLARVLFGLDMAVGKILEQLRKHPRGPGRTLEDDTLIFFTSDNGGDTNFGGVNLPLRGRKTELYEGGIRVPYLLYWKGRLAPAVLDAPVSTLDFLPTALAAAGAPLPPNLDGVNLLPYIQNPAGPKPHERLFWRVETNGVSSENNGVLDGLRAMRHGNWKIVKPGALATWELYNLAADPSESTDLADTDPDRLRQMLTDYRAWSAPMVRPLWAVDDLNYADPAFILEDIRVGSPTTSYLATDFLSGAGRFAYQDATNALRHDAIDLATGFPQQAPVLVDTGLAPIASSVVGPQWGLASGSASLFYTKPGAGARNQIWRAMPGAPIALTNTTGLDNSGARASRDLADNAVQLAFTAGTRAAWANAAPPRTTHTIPDHSGGATNGRWIPGTSDLAYAGTPLGVTDPQIMRLRTATNTAVLISNDPGAKSDVWAYYAPEFGSALCYAAVVNRAAIAIYADVPGTPGTTFQRVATLTLPAGALPNLHSMRPIDGLRGFNGVSYFTCIASANPDPKVPGSSQVWLLGLGPDASHRVARRIDAGTGARFGPQTVIGTNAVFAYYTRSNGVDPAQLRLAATGLGKPNHASAGGFPALQYEWSFIAGVAAAFNGTETTHLIPHAGKLYAGQGSVGNPAQKIVNGNVGPNWTGAQLIVKDSPTAAWRVDRDFPAHLRVEAMDELTLTTRGTEQLGTPDKLLVAAMSDITAIGAAKVSVRTRDEAASLAAGTGVWNDSHPVNLTGVAAFPTSFGAHRVGVDATGIHFVFAGISNGEIHRATSTGTNLVWHTAPELSGGGAITGFAEANGRLYAASAVKQSGGVLEGGLFVRTDLPTASWQRVFRWTPPVPINSSPLAQRALTGLTSVSDPRGTGRDVLIGALSWPGVIVRVDPAENHATTVELDVRDFFARRWNNDRIRTADATIGYTRFTPAVHPVTGAKVHLIGLWIEHPNAPQPPNNGSHYLIRHADGTYEAADLQGMVPAVPPGQTLRATRAIAVSPFAADLSRVFYFGGYDVAGDTVRNSAWIVRSR